MFKRIWYYFLGSERTSDVRSLRAATDAATDSRQEQYQPDEEHCSSDAAPGFLLALDLESRRVVCYRHPCLGLCSTKAFGAARITSIAGSPG